MAPIAPKAVPLDRNLSSFRQGHLYASTESEVAYLPLADCDQYKENCWKCVLARDPYCGWDSDNKTCAEVSQDGNRTGRSVEVPNAIVALNWGERRE